jgi:GTPase SAR1 family protein
VTGQAGSKPSLKPLNTAQCTSIIDAMKEGTPPCFALLRGLLSRGSDALCYLFCIVYKAKVKPFEEQYRFGSFFSPLLTDADFDGKPQVLLLGQYSTGKTTFIRHLIGREYPGCHIGPEPTTDRFVVVCHGQDDRITPGNTLAVQPDKPYGGLSNFGSGFLSKFQASQCCAKLLEEITIVDTPGVLSGEKQRIERSYNFVEVCEWFAARCDVIVLLFDPHKLDISDEFKSVIASLRGHDDKVRVVLNKADQVDAQQLLRVYGALMWSLGKVRLSSKARKCLLIADCVPCGWAGVQHAGGCEGVRGQLQHGACFTSDDDCPRATSDAFAPRRARPTWSATPWPRSCSRRSRRRGPMAAVLRHACMHDADCLSFLHRFRTCFATCTASRRAPRTAR